MNKEIEIPEGYEARIEGNKVILEWKKSEEERIRMALCDIVRDMPYMETELRAHGFTVKKTLAYLEKQKEPIKSALNPNDSVQVAYGKGVNDVIENPDAYGLCKPAEWSEEDEENFKWFDKLFRAESVMLGGRDIPQDKYLWFKSLRTQHHWKPSEEQMKSLKSCVYGGLFKMEVLQELYNDLLEKL